MMRSETSRVGSVPEAGVAVKAILAAAVAGQPVRLRDYGLDVSGEATADEVLAALASIRDVENASSVRTKFCQGDLFRAVDRRGAIKREFIAGVKAEYGEAYYNALRRYAWVAGKWREDRRTDTKCWAWYVNNDPGRPGLPKREKLPTMVRFVSSEIVPAGVLRMLVDSAGNKFTEVVPIDDSSTRSAPGP